MKAPQRLTRVALMAPLTGVMVPIESVPDPVFAEKMVGDGVSIDPVSDELLAPLAGKITQLHRAAHAVTVTGESGIEVLIHIGLDTVMLRGEGFTPLVSEGDTVATGQPLIRFDPLFVGAKAVSLLTQMVIANGELVTRYEPATGIVLQRGAFRDGVRGGLRIGAHVCCKIIVHDRVPRGRLFTQKEYANLLGLPIDARLYAAGALLT